MIRDATITAADVALCSPRTTSKARQWCRGWERAMWRWGGEETLQQDPVQFDVEALFNDEGRLERWIVAILPKRRCNHGSQRYFTVV